MERFIVVGRTRLEGKVRISGSKNAVLPIMAASLLAARTSTITNVPSLADVATMKQVLEHLGARVVFTGEVMEIDASTVSRYEVAEPLTRRMRASNLVMGPLLGRARHVRVSHPGGCDIGSRPMDLHVKGFQCMGAAIQEKFGFIEAEGGDLHGAEIHLDFPSVGATENLMMAAVLARGQTIIRNAAKEPEIVDLQNFLNRLGAKIKGAGLDVIRIDGVSDLNAVEYSIIPDRIEAGTFMTAAAITGGDVLINNIIPEHLEAVTSKLRETGITVTEYTDSIRVKRAGRPRAVDFKTMPYPGFPTDLQPQVMALMATANGTAIISETIFDNRFKHVDELRRLGANIKVEGHAAIVKGVPRLSGALVEATDLRAGAGLVLAGLGADDATVIENIHHIDRGYTRIDDKLNALGARVIRVNGQQR